MIVNDIRDIEMIDEIDHFAERAVDVTRFVADKRNPQADALQFIKILNFSDGDIKRVSDAFLDFADHAAFAFEAIISRNAQIDAAYPDDHRPSVAPRVSWQLARAQMVR